MTSLRTIRVRLTLWYGGLFLVAGFLLLTLNFLLVQRNFPDDPTALRVAAAERLGIPIGELQPNRRFQFQGGFSGRPPAQLRFDDLLDGVAGQIKSDTLEQLLIQSTIALGLMAVVSMGLGWLLAGRMLRPLGDISATVRRITEESLDQRVSLQGPPDELKELADQFDVMLDRLEASFRAQREFVSNASHELRTPLTIIRAELDVTLAEPDASPEDLARMGDVVRRAIDRSERLIDQLLLLARADEPIRRTDSVDLAAAVERALQEQERAIAERGLVVESELSPVTVSGDRVLLEQLVANLIDNSVRHNVAGGRLSVTVERRGEHALIRVANDGAVIPPDDAERLFRRFARLDESRARATGGYGIGLSLVRTIAEGHEGTARAEARPNGGLAVEVRLPAADSEHREERPAPPAEPAEQVAEPAEQPESRAPVAPRG